MLRGETVSERVRDQALAPLECDVPDRWSLAEYRTAVELRAELELPWWRRLRRTPRRAPAPGS